MPDKCTRPATWDHPRQRSWMGGVTDRTVLGVIAHELGHHVDFTFSAMKDSTPKRIFSTEIFSEWIQLEAKRRSTRTAEWKPITSYHANVGEWFAEMFRVYLLNPALLWNTRWPVYEVLNEFMGLDPAVGFTQSRAADRLKEFGAPQHIVDYNLKKYLS